MNLQLQTLRLYGELLARHDSYAGKIVFSCAHGAITTGVAAATCIAGGTALIVDADSAAVKSVMRHGGVDFVVNSLDEALRVLKNEVRQGRPLGVALVADPALVLAEMKERGVLPDLQLELSTPIERLARETFVLTTTPSETLTVWLDHKGWQETTEGSATTAALRALDKDLLSQLPETDTIRRRWLERISRYTPPAVERVFWTNKEA